MKKYGFVVCLCVSLAFASCEFLFAPSRNPGGQGSVVFNVGNGAGGTRSLIDAPAFPRIEQSEVRFYTNGGGGPVFSRTLAGAGPYTVSLPAGTYTAKIVAKPANGNGVYSFSSVLAGETSNSFTVSAGETTPVDPISMRPVEQVQFRFYVDAFVDQNANPAQTLTIWNANSYPTDTAGNPALDLPCRVHTATLHPYFYFDEYGRLILLGYFPDASATFNASKQLKIFENFSGDDGSVLAFKIEQTNSLLAYDNKTQILFLGPCTNGLDYIAYQDLREKEDGSRLLSSSTTDTTGTTLSFLNFPSFQPYQFLAADGYLYAVERDYSTSVSKIHKYEIQVNTGVVSLEEVSTFSNTIPPFSGNQEIRDIKVIKGMVIVLLQNNDSSNPPPEGKVHIFDAETGAEITGSPVDLAKDETNALFTLVNPTRILGADDSGIWLFDYLEESPDPTNLSSAKNLHVNIDW
jgi:hypothetical protein